MADIADNANDHIEREMAGRLSVRKPIGPTATGRCLSCETLLEAGKRWCDASCRDDFERDDRARKARVVSDE